MRNYKNTTDYLILAEKPSAAKTFIVALGGVSGTFDSHLQAVIYCLQFKFFSLKLIFCEFINQRDYAQLHKTFDIVDEFLYNIKLV